MLRLMGVSYRTAPLAVREALSFDDETAGALLRQAAAERTDFEGVILSTCNRTEIYLAADDPGAVDAFMARVCSGRGIRHDDSCYVYRKEGVDAVEHLLRVAGGLESSILGDQQILGQVRRAVAVASRSGSYGGTLSRAFTHAIRVGRKARSQTAIGSGAASLGSAVAGMVAARAKGELAGLAITILGAGDVARDIGRHLAKRGAESLTFVNRTAARADRLAADCGGKARPWAELLTEFVTADVVIAATGAPRAVIHATDLAAAARYRHTPLIVIDAGMPRNAEADPSAEVIDIDHIREQQRAVLERRRAAVPDVENLVAEQLRRWTRWTRRKPMEGVIKTLYRDLDEVARSSARQLSAELELPADEAELIVQRSVRRLLHHHVRRLRALDVAAVQVN